MTSMKGARRPRFATQLRAVMVKEIRQTVRDKRIVALLLLAPFLQLLVLGNAVNLEVDRVPAAVVDRDDSPRSRALLEGLFADGTIERVATARGEAEAEAMLVRGEVAVAVLVPPGLDRDVVRGRPASVQVVVDGSDPNRSGVAASAASRYFAAAGVRVAQARLRARAGGGPAVSAGMGAGAGVGAVLVPRVAYNPQLRTAVFMIPGVSGMILLVVTTIATAMGLAREREVGTLEQVMVTPLPPAALLAGKLLPFLAIGLLDFGLAVAAGTWLFDVPLRGSLLLLTGATLLYLVCTLGMGLLISTVSGSQQQAFVGGMLFMLPAVLLSGTLTPVRSMPAWLQPITYVNPLRYYMEILRGGMLKASSAGELWMQLVALAVMGAVILGVATLRFRKQMG